MNCYKKEILIDYIEGELKADERRAVEEHLSLCPVCSKEVADLRHLYTLLEADVVEEPNRSIIRDNIEKAIRKRSPFRIIYLFPAPVAVAAAVLLIFLLNRGSKDFEPSFYYPPAQYVYEGSDTIQVTLLAELIEIKTGTSLAEISADLDNRVEMSELLEELTESEQRDFYKSLKNQFGPFNGT